MPENHPHDPQEAAMPEQNLLFAVAHGIATVTINRPSALNALNRDTIAELGAVVRRISEATEIRVAIITGAGEKAFVAGADIAMMRDLSPLAARELALSGQQLCTAIATSPKPFIAAVNGYALGGGCELAMSCDLRFAASTARFGQPEINLGILPGFGGSQRLPRLIGTGRALELILSGEMIDAAEAHRIGLVNRVLPAAELMRETEAFAARLASKGLPALQRCKEAVMVGREMDLARALDYEAAQFGLCFATNDQQEGMTAFLEKRPAAFTDS
jgi:enoyl-CoA hydratase